MTGPLRVPARRLRHLVPFFEVIVTRQESQEPRDPRTRMDRVESLFASGMLVRQADSIDIPRKPCPFYPAVTRSG